MAARTSRGGGCLRLAAAWTVVVLSACSGGTSDDEAGDTPPSPGGVGEVHVGLTATVVQQRLDVGTTRIGLEVTTDHRTTVHVDGVQLLSDAFEEQPMTAKDTDFGPDRTIDLTVDYGRPVCDPVAAPDDAEVLVRYQVPEGDVSDATQTLPVAELGLSLLGNHYSEGCAEQRLDEAATVAYRTPFHRQVVEGQLSLVGDLVLDRPANGGSGEPVVVESVFGSVLFEFFSGRGGAPAGTLDQGRSSSTVPVVIRGNNRCSPHERSASQQTFVFTAVVRVGVAAAHRLIIEPPTSLQVQALALLDDVCA